MRFARYVHFSHLSMVGVLALAALARPVAVCAGGWAATPNSGAQSVVVGSDGAVYTDWGAAFSDQIARSTDHGVSWQPSSGPGSVGFSFYQTRALAVDPSGAIYAAFNAGGNANFHAELSVSRDAGASWTLLLSDSQTQYLDLRVDPFSPQTLYLLDGLAGLFGHLRRSSDGGAHWTEIDGTLVAGIGAQGSVTALALDSQTPGRLYAAAAGPSGVLPPVPVLFTSSDGGSTWTRSAAILPAIFAILVVDPFQSSGIYGGGATGIFRSNDGGQTFVSESAVPATQIVADPVHAGRLYAATPTSGVLASADAGATWTPLNTGLTNLTVSALALDAAAGYLYAATWTGVFVYQFPNPGTLVLNAAHPFTITLSATDQRTGRTGAGVATQVNDLWGYFGLPAITGNPNNPEVFVKLLDGTAINGRYWFFYGGLTDLEYTLTVHEDATGLTRTYTKPAGSECGGSDTGAFGP
jgi:photosystem II stability/assembly factor-like uncharacterized protein